MKIFKFVERLEVILQYLTNEVSKVKENIAAANWLHFPFYFAYRIASRLKTTVKRKKVKGKKLKSFEMNAQNF